MRSARFAALFLFLFAEALWVTYGSPLEYLPPIPDLGRFPHEVGGWSMQSEDPIDPASLKVLNADATLSRTYTEKGAFWSAQLLVAWFQTQLGGEKQPHSPKVCFPAAGWITLKSDTIRAGELQVNRYVVADGPHHGVMLYWYRTPFRNETSEWAAKFWSVDDALLHRRTDTALLRIFVPSSGNDEAASAAAVRFLESARPALEQDLPR